MKKVISQETISFKLNSSETIELSPKGTLVQDEVAHIIANRFPSFITIEDCAPVEVLTEVITEEVKETTEEEVVVDPVVDGTIEEPILEEEVITEEVSKKKVKGKNK